jgi:hypothetical protein
MRYMVMFLYVLIPLTYWGSVCTCGVPTAGGYMSGVWWGSELASGAVVSYWCTVVLVGSTVIGARKG